VTQVLACFLRKVTGLPYIVTCHGFFKVRFTRRMFPCWGVKTIAVSQEVRQHLVDDFCLQPRCVWAIPNGIDSSRFEPPSAQDKASAKARFGLGPGPVVGIIARLSSVKGHIYLIQAMKLVLVRHPAAQLFIVGEGPEEARLRHACRESGLKAHVLFVSEVAQTSQALAAMDLFVMPSLQEGLGLSLMEAMACGLAVIGSNVGGIKSLILDGQHGILIPPKDPASLAGAIDALLSDPARAHLWGQRARQFISANFSESTMIVQTERLYAECVKKKGI
jgi:glycosyltransferase involved in cell wall biosynthesis